MTRRSQPAPPRPPLPPARAGSHRPAHTAAAAAPRGLVSSVCGNDWRPVCRHTAPAAPASIQSRQHRATRLSRSSARREIAVWESTSRRTSSCSSSSAVSVSVPIYSRARKNAYGGVPPRIPRCVRCRWVLLLRRCFCFDCGCPPRALYDFRRSVKDLTEILASSNRMGRCWVLSNTRHLPWGGVQGAHTAPMAAHGAPQAAWHRSLTG